MPSADRCQQGFDTGSGRTGQTISDAQNETRGGWNKRKEEEDKRRKRNKRRTEQEEDRARGGLNKGRMEQAAIGSRGGWNKGSMEQEEKDGIREGRWNKRRMEQEEKGRGEWDKTMHQEEDDRIGEGRWNKRRIKHEDDGRGGWNRKMEQGEEDGMGDGKWKKRMVREAKGARGGSNKRWMEQVEKGGGWNKRWMEQEVDGTRGGWNRRRQMENKLDESSDCNSAGPAANHVLVGASLRGESRMIWEDQIQQAFDYGLGRTGQATSGAQKQDSGSAEAQLLLAIVSARWSYRFGLVLPPLSCCFPLKVDRQMDVLVICRCCAGLCWPACIPGRRSLSSLACWCLARLAGRQSDFLNVGCWCARLMHARMHWTGPCGPALRGVSRTCLADRQSDLFIINCWLTCAIGLPRPRMCWTGTCGLAGSTSVGYVQQLPR